MISDLGSQGLYAVDAPYGVSEAPACLGEVEGVLKRQPRKHLRREDVRKFHVEGLEDVDAFALQVPNCRRYVSVPSGDGDVYSHLESEASLWRQVQSCCPLLVFPYPKAFLGRDAPLSFAASEKKRSRRRRKGTLGTRTLRFLGTETKRRVLSRYDLSTRLTPSRTDPHLPPQPSSTRR